MLSGCTRRVLFVRLVLLSTLFMLFSACKEADKNEESSVIRPVRTAIAKSTSAEIVRTYPAVVLPAQQAELAFRIPGRIVELPVRAAESVKKDQALAKLDTRQFEAAVSQLESQLEQATAELTAMQAGARTEDLASLRAKVVAAQSDLDQQQTRVDALKRLVDQGAAPRAEYEQEQAKLSRDRASLDVAQQELAKAEIGERPEVIEAQEAAIRGLQSQLAEAQADLRDTTLRAPFDGVISSRRVENFTNIQANSVVAVMQNLETIDLQFDIPGADVAVFAQQNETVNRVRLDVAADAEFEAQFVEFGTQADPATQTFRCRVSIDSPEGVTVLPGMTGSIRVTSGIDDQQGILIPESALVAELDGSTFVWIVDKQTNSVSKRRVTAEDLSGGDVTVDGDLNEGDIVVTAGVSFLSEGQIVSPMSTESE